MKPVEVVHASNASFIHIWIVILKKFQEINPKNSFFLVSFQRFLDHAFLHPKGDALIFGQMKGLMEIHNAGKFH